MSVKLGELYYELNIEDQTKKDLSEAKRKVSLWERATKAVVGVSADWTDAKAELKAAGKAVGDLDGTSARVRVDGDGSAAEKAIASVGDAFDELQVAVDDNPIVPQVDVNKIDDGAAEGRGSLLNMLDGWKVAAVAAAAVGGAAIADQLIEGFNSVLERNRENDRLAASLGLTEDQSTIAGRIAGDLWVSAFGESTGQVNEAVRAALLSLPQGGTLGSATGDVKSISEDALNLAAIFDVDVTDSIARAAQLVKSGLAPDMNAAFDLIFASMQRIPTSMTGDMLDAIDEYSKHLAPLGFTGEQIFGLLVTASKDGAIAVDKTGDALKEFTIRSSDMSATSVAAYDAIGLNAHDMAAKLLAGGEDGKKTFGMIVDGLLSIEDPVQRQLMALNLFGTPLEDLSTAQIPDFLRRLQGVDSGLGDVEGAAKDAGRTLKDNLATDIEEVMRKLSPASLAQAFDQGGIEGLKNRVQEGVDKLKSIWDEYGPAVRELLRDAMNELSKWWDEDGEKFLNSMVEWWDKSGQPAVESTISNALGLAWEAVKAYFKDKVTDPEWWWDTLNNGMVDPVVEFFAGASIDLIHAATDWISGIPAAVARLAAGVWNPLADGFEGVINAIIDTWNNLSFDLPSVTVFGVEIGGGTISNPAKLPHVNIPTIDSGGGAFGQLGSQIPRFAKGGLVDAPVGKAVLAVLHGGEYVNTADEVRQGRTGTPRPGNRRQGRSGGPSVINVYTQAKTNRGTADAIDRRLMGWAG